MVLTEWENFNIILGSAAGGLIGLQFVVITLIATRPDPLMSEASAAFSTPTIVHFGVVLLLSAFASIPWHGTLVLSALWGLISVCGLIYSAVVARRMKAQTAYQSVLSDWTFHIVLPCVAHLLLLAGAVVLGVWMGTVSLFLVSAAMLLLLFVGIHNAWDAVTYHVFVYSGDQAMRQQSLLDRKDSASRRRQNF